VSVVADRPPRDAARTPGARSLLRWPHPAHAALIAVSAAYCLLVLWRTSQSMTLQYDEVVYASQVAREAPAAMFSAPRARGMSLLVAPVVVITESVLALRLYLVVLAGVLMYLGFRPWLAVFGRVGGRYAYVPPVAAGCFATLWLSVLYGNLAYPNLWLAFVLLAGVGYTVRAVTEPVPGWGPAVAVGVAFAVASLIRPTDALATAGPLLVGLLVVGSWRRLRPMLAIGIGLLVGWSAWIAEAYARFNGPVERLRMGGETNESGFVNSLPEHLYALDGPAVLCRPASLCAGVAPEAAVWWFALPVLVAIGLYAAGRAGWGRIGWLVTAVAGAVALPYFVLIDYAAPRFLLPTYGLLMILVAAALILVTGLGRVEMRALVAVAVTGAMLVHFGAQMNVLNGVNGRLVDGSAGQEQFADSLRDEYDVRAPCLIWGISALQLSYQLKCRSIPALTRLASPEEREHTILEAVARGDSVAVRMHTDVPLPAFMAGWRRVEPPGTGNYAVYLPPRGAP
jgi:hypothetical protein